MHPQQHQQSSLVPGLNDDLLRLITSKGELHTPHKGCTTRDSARRSCRWRPAKTRRTGRDHPREAPRASGPHTAKAPTDEDNAHGAAARRRSYTVGRAARDPALCAPPSPRREAMADDEQRRAPALAAASKGTPHTLVTPALCFAPMREESSLSPGHEQTNPAGRALRRSL